MNTDKVYIIVPTNYSENEDFAAQELGYFLRIISGTGTVLVREYEPTACLYTPYISLGRTEKFLNLFNPVNLKEEVGEDGYKIITEKDRAFICGGGGQGTIFGVYAFLKKLFNLTIFADDCYTYDKKPFELTEWSLTDKPDFPMRAIGIYTVHIEKRYPGTGNKRYCRRMRLRPMDEGWGINNHSYFRILPPEIYKENHPDWYSKNGTSICFSNPEMTKQFIENLKTIIENTPEDSLYMIGMEDYSSSCDCPNCNKLKEKYGGNDVCVMLYFTNNVVRAINCWLKEKYPNRKVYFFTFAYLWAEVPPVIKQNDGTYRIISEEIRPEENLGALIAPFRCNSSYALNDGRNYETQNTNYHSGNRMLVSDIFEGWKSIVNYLAVWTYNLNFYDYICPCPMWNGIQENFRWFKELNAMHVFFEAGCGGVFANFSIMKIYCVSQLMWDTSLELDTLVRNFCAAYFEEAAGEMYEYFVFLHKHCDWLDKTLNRQMLYMHFYDEPNGRILKAEFWPKDMLKNALNIFERAESKKLSEEVMARVTLEAIPVRFALIYLYRKELSIDEVKRQISLMRTAAKKTGMGYVMQEYPNDISAFLDMWEKEL